MISNTVGSTEFSFPGQQAVYHGKVRDVYDLGDKLLMIATDRISAFDHILPRTIPHKGQVLNQIAAYFLERTNHIVPNWLESTPDPNVAVGKKAVPLRVEMVIRGYLTGHAWREYKSGKRTLCGATMPNGMQENQKFPIPIITPTTKASEGHDVDITPDEIIKNNIVSAEDWATIERYTRLLFEKGTEMAADRGLILVDTKYEFGKVGNDIILIDEIHTPDSSRYFYLEGYEKRLANGEQQIQLSKEFVREWLIANGFQGKEGQHIPELSDEFIAEISDRYIHLFELLTGQNFIKEDTTDILQRIETNIVRYLNQV
ncbi:MAG: phosphoribosylaminoimidazolesuccinocarboxamide synthase [Saprospiraceae bacterium]|nr:MAG: phosphoribosylaminoimidazolesuccinocarboxamide synthase [Bacteroidetes bacterium OLB9]MCO6464745.1 phosphoribosylaminoimidazolesuccinocarboxamide synthase [Saprospiraceae bacterium]MCZ2339976.1 phosphoribosylaminoimidazolesuccinocarboxamide synthase [Chitinophagales bacterium]